MSTSNSSKDYVYPLKIDSEIIVRLKELAAKNRRTIRGEISIALENHIQKNKKK